jgi:hypothetical protein
VIIWNLFKQLFTSGSTSAPQADSPSIQKIVNFNSLNKRKNIRMKYPHFGAFGPFPKVTYKDHEMIVTNISVGGLMIIDDTEKFGAAVGEAIYLDLKWDDLTVKTRCRIVGVNLHRRHIQFVDFNAQSFLKISKLVKPGYLGGRFHRVRDDLGQIAAVELWVGPSSESLVFPKIGAFAELTLSGEKVMFNKDRKACFATSQNPIPVEMLSDLLIIIANLPEHTDKVKELLELIEVEMRSQATRKTG